MDDSEEKIKIYLIKSLAQIQFMRMLNMLRSEENIEDLMQQKQFFEQNNYITKNLNSNNNTNFSSLNIKPTQYQNYSTESELINLVKGECAEFVHENNIYTMDDDLEKEIIENIAQIDFDEENNVTNSLPTNNIPTPSTSNLVNVWHQDVRNIYTSFDPSYVLEQEFSEVINESQKRPANADLDQPISKNPRHIQESDCNDELNSLQTPILSDLSNDIWDNDVENIYTSFDPTDLLEHEIFESEQGLENSENSDNDEPKSLPTNIPMPILTNNPVNLEDHDDVNTKFVPTDLLQSTDTNNSNTTQQEIYPMDENIKMIIENNIFIENDEEMIIIGPNRTKVKKDTLNEIDWDKRGSIITRKILSIIFGDSVLATHNLSGKKSPAFIGIDKPIKSQLNPKIVSDVTHFMKLTKDMSASEVKAAVVAKCADACKKNRRSIKRRV